MPPAITPTRRSATAKRQRARLSRRCRTASSSASCRSWARMALRPTEHFLALVERRPRALQVPHERALRGQRLEDHEHYPGELRAETHDVAGDDHRDSTAMSVHTSPCALWRRRRAPATAHAVGTYTPRT